MSKGELTRGRILDQAMHLASRTGLEGLTIGSLSEALSLSKSGLFSHFGSKEAFALHGRARGALVDEIPPALTGAKVLDLVLGRGGGRCVHGDSFRPISSFEAGL